MFKAKKVEVTDALNSGDINKLYALHKRDNDFSFNNAEIRSVQYIQDCNALMSKHKKAEYLYLCM